MNDDRLVIDELSRFPAFGGIPTFFQFHLMSTHGLSKRDPNNAPFKPYHNYYADLVRKTVMVDSERETGYVNYYDNGVVRTDQAIRSILDSLEGKNYLRKALVVITADHGELLGEHGLFSHAKTVFAPVLDIPLMFLRYGYQPSDEISPSVVASQIDIAPTILAELGMPIPSSWSGFPLQRLKLVPAEDRFLFFQQGAEFGLIESGGQRQRWKYWVNANTGHEYAFDLLADPGEMRNGIDGVPSARREKWRVALLQAEVQARESSGIELLPE
jgi:arylsulfatase A-like enzyme